MSYVIVTVLLCLEDNDKENSLCSVTDPISSKNCWPVVGWLHRCGTHAYRRLTVLFKK